MQEPTLPKVYLKRKSHRGASRVMIHFAWNPFIIDILKKQLSCRWSQTNKCWYLDYERDNVEKLIDALKGKAELDHSSINVIFKELNSYKKQKGEKTAEFRKHLSPEKSAALEKFRRYLVSERYSDRTVTLYTQIVGNFLGFTGNKLIEAISLDDYHSYNYNVIIKHKYSISYQRQFVGALNLFLRNIATSSIVLDELKRPRKSKQLPIVLNKEQVKQIFETIDNIKHKTIISVLYSAGLRVGELTKLRLADIDYSRKLIAVKMSKGRKDRTVKLSNTTAYLIYKYLMKYKPKTYVFEGHKGKPYSSSSVRKILQKACERANIQQRVTPHTLRHSYATHMLELGVDIRYIQTLLGHSKPETTMIYTHVSNHKLQELANPLDEIWKEELMEMKVKRNFLGDKIPFIPGETEGEY